MGSLNVEESPSIEEVRADDRPNFYPCMKCGEKFTFRALNVHRNKCRDNDSCYCICCSHRAKRRRLNPELENAKDVCEQSMTPSNNGNTLQNIPQNSNMPIPTSNLKKILLIPSVNGIIKPFPLSLKTYMKGSDSLNGGIRQKEGTAKKNERFISVIKFNPGISNGSGNAANNSENMDTRDEKEAGESEQTGKSKEKPVIPLKKIFHTSGEQCKRKMFCSMCNNHVYWGTYGTHIIEHCVMVDDKPVCPICSVTSASKANFLMHYYEHYSNHPATCPECKCSDESCQMPWNRSEDSNTARNVNLCFICRDIFTHFQSLINHMRLHSSETPFHCTECSRKFRQVGNLTRHMTTHRGIKPHKCCECDKSFADPATLRNHVRTHTKETPYICPICKRGFSQVGNLKRHKVVHDQHGLPRPPPSMASPPAQETPVASSVEPTPSTVPNDPPRKGRQPQENLFECDQCGKKFAWSYDLETHYRVHSGEKPYQCDVCKKRFAQSGAVRMHKQRHHNGPETDSSKTSSNSTESV